MQPYEKGYFDVGAGHQLYYERCGNKKGIPAVFLHGGPGSGFAESHKKFFNLKDYNVLFYDQRGAGRSQPFANIKNNTTQDLVDDLNKLLDHFKLKKVLIFGGSWGSTLALVYAIQNPKRIAGLILRGIFLANQESIDHYLGGGVATYAPEAWQRFANQFPNVKGKKLVAEYYKKFKSNNLKQRRHYAYEWARFEMSILTLQDNNKDLDKFLKQYHYESLAVLECHYLRKNCFLADDYILKNCGKLKNIPISIIHGRYDLVCPPKGAFDLKQKLKHAKLNFVCAGHASSDPEIYAALMQEVKAFALEHKK